MREMGSFDRSKKRMQLWKKAALHFSLCFVMGFFTGFAPTSTASLFSGQANPYQSVKNLGISAKPTEALHLHKSVDVPGSSLNRSLLMSKIPSDAIATNASGAPRIQEPLPLAADDDDSEESNNRELLIIVTTTKSGDRLQGPLLTRLANTLKLVSSPLLWVVVEARSDAPRTAETLRRTGIMYRHLTYADNFTDAGAEADHQRNVALNHVEFHRLNGIVHFADVSNVYDLEFFEEIREIEVFGAWPVVMASANRKRVVVEGPVCRSFKVVGWQSKDLSSHETKDATTPNDGVAETNPKPSKINISGFAFNSSILWDPERWGRPTSVPDTSQDSVKFVQEVVLQDETKLRAIPPDCSKIMLWHLHIPSDLPLPSSQYQNRR